MSFKFAATERTTASLQSNTMISGYLNNDKNKGERIQKLRQTVNVLQAHSWIGKCSADRISIISESFAFLP